MRLYIGNLPPELTTEQLTDLVTPYGAAASVRVVTERGSGVSRGFGFVEMEKSEEALAAITALNGREVSGNPLVVNEARPMGAPRQKV